MNPTKKTARIAGLFWFLMALTGAFGLIYIRSYVIVPGDAAATANNVMSSELLFRAAVVSTLLAQVFLLFFGLTLFQLFKDVDSWLCLVLLVSTAMAALTGIINQFNNFGALLILSRPDFLGVFTPEQLNAFAFFLVRQANSTGQGLIEIFWVPYYFSFGLLVVKSGYLPKIFGFLLMLASLGFAANLLNKFLAPFFYPAMFTQTAMMLSAFTLIPTMLWLLIMGAKNKRPPAEAEAEAAA